MKNDKVLNVDTMSEREKKKYKRRSRVDCESQRGGECRCGGER